MKKKYRFLFFCIGIVGVFLLAKNAELTDMDWQELLRTRLLLLFALEMLLWALIYGIHAGIYREIIGPDARRMGFLHLYKICVAGFALNNVTPAGLFGGEPYRIMELKRFVSTEKAASSTLTFSLLYAMGHALLWSTGALVYLLMGCPGEWPISVITLGAGVVCTAFCLYFLTRKKQGLVLPCLKFFARIPLLGRPFRSMLSKNYSLYQEVDAGIAAFRSEPRRFRRALALEYLSRLMEALEYYMILRFIGEALPIYGGLLIMSTASLVGNLMFMIPMQAGTREGGTAMAVAWLGLDAAAGFMGCLIYRVRDLVCTLIGVLCILIEKKIHSAGN